jgi:hypothetical protein
MLLIPALSSVVHADPVIRVVHPVLAQSLDDLYAASASARAHIEELERTDLLIHVVALAPVRRGDFTGTTHFVTAAGGRRVLRIAVNETLPPEHRAAALAHELYHALEVARTAWAIDRSSFAILYRRIGYPSEGHPHGDCYETTAAIVAGRQALAEYRQHSTIVDQ